MTNITTLIQPWLSVKNSAAGAKFYKEALALLKFIEWKRQMVD